MQTDPVLSPGPGVSYSLTKSDPAGTESSEEKDDVK